MQRRKGVIALKVNAGVPTRDRDHLGCRRSIAGQKKELEKKPRHSKTAATMTASTITWTKDLRQEVDVIPPGNWHHAQNQSGEDAGVPVRWRGVPILPRYRQLHHGQLRWRDISRWGRLEAESVSSPCPPGMRLPGISTGWSSRQNCNPAYSYRDLCCADCVLLKQR